MITQESEKEVFQDDERYIDKGKIERAAVRAVEEYIDDFEKMKLYIAKDDVYRAEVRYAQKKKVNIVYAVLFILLLAALAFIVCEFAVPDLLRMLDNFIGLNAK